MFRGQISRKPCARPARFVTLLTQHRAADLWLERHSVVFAAVVANDLKPLWRIVAHRSALRPAARASLRGHHIALVKLLLVLFGKKKDLLALHTRNFDIRHRVTSTHSIAVIDLMLSHAD